MPTQQAEWMIDKWMGPVRLLGIGEAVLDLAAAADLHGGASRWEAELEQMTQ